MLTKKFIVACIFFACCLSSAQAAHLLDRVVAIVNQEVITWSELYRSMEYDAVPGMKKLSEEERMKVFKENEAGFLENLINFRLQLQAAKELGIRVSDAEVQDAIEGIKKKYKMSEIQFQESLKTEGYSFDEYKKRLREQIIISKVVNQQVRNKVLATDQDVDAFLRDNRSFEGSTERFHIRQIFFKKPVDAADRTKTEELSQAVYEKIMQGQDFDALVKEYSEGPNRNAGGDLGFIDKESLAKEFSVALSGMQVGDVSKPFWTDAGVHIIKLDEKTEKKSPAEIRENARNAISNKLFTERYNAWIKSLREKAFIDVRL